MIKIINIDKSPISLIGKNAAVCYGKPIDTVMGEYSESDYKRGLACIESGHGRALEYAAVDVEVSGYSARCIREVYTHIVGATRLQESTRYIDMNDFGYFIPKSIADNPKAHMIYVYLMDTIKSSYERLRECDIPVEDCANVLPLAYHSRITFKINVRSLLHLAEERLCSRAYHEIRDFVNEFKKVLYSYGDTACELEWQEIALMMQPKCRKLGYCPEKKGCGMMISKKEAMDILRDHNKPDILNKKFNLPGETRTCPICGKPIHSSLKICVECFNEIMPVNTDADDGRYIPNMFCEAGTDDGKINKMDRV